MLYNNVSETNDDNNKPRNRNEYHRVVVRDYKYKRTNLNRIPMQQSTATESSNESISPLAHTTYNSLVAMSMAHAQYFRDRKMRRRFPARSAPERVPRKPNVCTCRGFDRNTWNHCEFRSDACRFWRRYTL